MTEVVRLTVLRVTSASMAQHSPAHGTAALSGQCTSPSGRCSRSPARPAARTRSRRSLRQNAPACWYSALAAKASRTVATARVCASRDSAGEMGG